ncbi:helix-turn-helix domain-containing protein [Nesterenkonia populi]|uniref:helix-turn-helix domain-containing protein n=1 Tax=Nesterenkonia populi TaxID=1591087 RepID=UPI0011BD5CD5|nr:helix-turn-helix domain-containing protein [Nesterenkonia populi]
MAAQIESAAGKTAIADSLLSVEQVCQLLGVKKTYVYSRMNNGELAYVPLSDGKREFRRVRPKDLDAFLESRLVPAR